MLTANRTSITTLAGSTAKLVNLALCLASLVIPPFTQTCRPFVGRFRIQRQLTYLQSSDSATELRRHPHRRLGKRFFWAGPSR